MYDFKFRMKVMLISMGSWLLSSALLLIIFALADLQAWCFAIAIMLPGVISVPLGLHTISKHEEAKPLSETQESQNLQTEQVERQEGYVRLFRGSPIPKNPDGTFDVYSESFDTFAAAAQFADVFQHNYYTPGSVQETPDGKFYVVGNGAEACMLRSCFAENENIALVANWKYENRGKQKAQEYFNAKKRKIHTRNIRYASCVIVWIVALILILTSNQVLLSALIVIPLAAVFSYFIVSPNRTIIGKKSYSWTYIDQMDGITFERFIGSLIVQHKYGSVEYTSATGDFGVDIILNGRTAIQCKRSAQNLGIKPIQEVYTGMNHYGCNEAIVVTNAHFTKNAVQLANELNVTLWDRNTLSGML